MEYRRCVVVDARLPEGFVPTESSNRLGRRPASRCSPGSHEVDYRAARLDDLGRADGFLARQVASWMASRYEGARTGDIPQLTTLVNACATGSALAARSRSSATISNQQPALRESGADAVRPFWTGRWRRSAGPLFDLAIFLCYWVAPDDPTEL